MSTATLTKKELFVQGSLTTDVAEMIEMLAVNVPGVKSCNVNAVNKSLVLSIDTTKDEGAVINELSSLIKTMDSSLKLTTSRQENKNNSKAQRKSAEGDKNVSIILGGLNCAHCAEVIGQKVEDLDEVEMAHLNFVNKKLSFELKDGASRKLTIDKVINIIDTTEPGLNIQVHDNRGTKELKLKLENLTCKQCADQIEFEANKAKGVKSATLDFGNCILDVELDGTVSRRVVTEGIATIAKNLQHCLNIQVKGISKAQNKALNEKVTKKFDKDKLDKIRLFVGVIAYAITFIQQVWGGNHGHANQDMISTVAFIAVYLVVGGDVLLKAAKNIKNGRVFDENFLITVATLGAIIIGETSEAVGVFFLLFKLIVNPSYLYPSLIL